jgi:sporulation protein YlmC with PRC-barrel domain
MDLIRDVLDKQLMDRQGKPMGKVDGLVLELSDEEPPRVAYVEVGALTQARRLHPRFEKLVVRLLKRWGVRSDEAFRLPWSKIVSTGNDVTANVEAEETPALALELWLRKKVIGRIPGA